MVALAKGPRRARRNRALRRQGRRRVDLLMTQRPQIRLRYGVRARRRDPARRAQAADARRNRGASRRRAYERGKQDALAQAERRIAPPRCKRSPTRPSAVLSRLDARKHAPCATKRPALAFIAAHARSPAPRSKRSAPSAPPPRSTRRWIALRHQPRLVVKLAPATAEMLRPRIADMCETHAYAGAVLVRAEPGLRAGEVMHRMGRGRHRHRPREAARSHSTH